MNTTQPEISALTSCFYCGGPADLLLCTRFRPGGAPVVDMSQYHKKVHSMEPCSKCREYMKQGVICISVRDGESGNNPYRTGRQVVLRDQYFVRMGGEVAQQVLRARFAFIEDKVWTMLGLPTEKAPATPPDTNTTE